MAKTLQSLIKEAVNLCDESGFANAQWVEWLNNGIDDIAPVLYIDKKATIDATPAGFPLPSDYLSTIRVDGNTKNLRLLDPMDDESTGYKLSEGNFILQNDSATTITLWYYSAPAYFDTALSTTPIAQKLEQSARALVFYACAMGMLFEDEPERYQVYIDMYNSAKAIINQNNLKKRAGRVGAWGVVR
jgi:hypothetical protein